MTDLPSFWNLRANLPIRYIGVGEKIEDLREFNAEEFIEALFVHENEE